MLSLHSSLVAVGEAGISSNVLAGLHHDHILVPVSQCDEAARVLLALAGRPGTG